MRKSCSDCSWKHLCQALVISHELAWYDGNEDDDHLDDLVGHLAEAGDQIQKENQYIADQIREQRVMMMKEGASAVRKLNIRLLIKLVREHAQTTKSILGTEPPESDPLEDLSKITKTSGK